MDSQQGGERPPQIEDWEFDLIAAAARRVKPSEQKELRAELARKLLVLKSDPPDGIRIWKAYLKGFLRNKRANWLRDRRVRTKREVSLQQPATASPDNPFTLGDVLASSEPDHDLQIDVRRLWRELSPELQAAWQMLDEEQGNQASVARRLGKHRNTVASWVRKIRNFVAARGLQPTGLVEARAKRRRPVIRQATGARPSLNRSIVIPAALSDRLERAAYSGTQWRIVLWVLREMFRRRQKTTSFSWYRIAKELSLDRGDTYRAGMGLVRAHLLFLENGRIGTQRHSRRARNKKRRSAR